MAAAHRPCSLLGARLHRRAATLMAEIDIPQMVGLAFAAWGAGWGSGFMFLTIKKFFEQA